MSIIATHDLSFGYGNKTILKNIDFSAKQGEIVSLIGPNGSGKSTLLRCLCGVQKVMPNTVFINGCPIDKNNSKKTAQNVSFLPQFQENIKSISVYELVSMGRSPYHASGWIMNNEDKEKVEWALGYMSLTEYRDRPVSNLSGGERQRVWIAMTLAQDTPAILLDEPVTYMDLKHQQELLSVILDLKNNYNKTIISVFHDINHAMEVSDVVYMMKDGKIHSKGSPEDVLTEESICEVYDVFTHVCKFKKCRRGVIVPEGCRYKKFEKR